MTKRAKAKEIDRAYRLICYLSAMAQGHVMLSRQMITEKEFLLFEKMIHRKYKIKEKSIYRDSRVIHRSAKGKYA